MPFPIKYADPQGKPSYSFAALHAKAILWLSRREYAAKELLTRMQRYSDEETAQAVLQDLQKNNLQSDERYVSAKIYSLSKKFGWSRIRRDLQLAGIDSTLISQVHLSDNQEDSEVSKALAILQKKAATPPATAAERAKLIRFMQGRGFAWSIIDQALKQHKDLEA